MKITKFGHSCLLIKEGEAKVLIDPGPYSSGQNDAAGLDVILITQEHFDHVDMPSLKAILSKNPQAAVMTNKGTALLLKKEGIESKLLEHGQSIEIKGILVEGSGKKHAEIYPTLPSVDNTGYFIAKRFFYPGDAFVDPGKKVEILALPVAGPWLKISEAIDYAKEINPKVCFPVHDGLLKAFGSAHTAPQSVLGFLGIEFEILELGKSVEF